MIKWSNNIVPENFIDEEAFNLLDSESIKELVPQIGKRLKFIKLYDQFKKVYNISILL